MTKVAVVGGAGFIGTRFCHRLAAEGKPFAILDKRMSETFPEHTILMDVTEPEGWAAALAGHDTVVNLAAEHRDDVRPKSLYDLVNVDGARNVCAAAEDAGVQRMVFTSSVAVYGFASPDTAEEGAIDPFNDYGRTKAEAESVYRKWQALDPSCRTLVIVRPTVVFGERNRGNVYNLLRQISSGLFVMIGTGTNRKSMAYVENVAAFLGHVVDYPPGVHVFNYVDKPDLTMNDLVAMARAALNRKNTRTLRIPYWLGYALAGCFDALARVTFRSFPISRVRVRKFCSTTQFASAAHSSGFRAPVSLNQGISRTLRSEFVEKDNAGPIFYSE